MSRSLRVLAMGSDTTVCGQCSKQFDALRFLQAYRVPNLGIDICKIKNLRFMDYTFMENEIWSLPKNFSTLQVLKLRRSWGTFGGDITKRSWGTYGGDTHADIGLGHLINLKHLELHGFHNTQISSFVNVYGLQKLKLSRIEGLKELPGSIRKLRSLQELHLDACSDLMRLGEGFGELSSLTKLGLMSCWALEELPCEFQKLLLLQSLNLWSCSSLVRLPEGLENLPSLKYINVNGCKKLISLPNGICKLSLSENTISFSGISNLKEIPEEICKFTTLTSLSLSFCKSLKVLPIGFGQLSCLEKLYLDGCESLQELCDDFHCLAGLKILSMSGCKSLSRLPEGFGKLGCLERLELSRCDNTQELCSDFGCLRALKYLVLSKCKSLYKLPDCFGQLGCLETLDLSTCSNLEELSSDFHGLTSLISLDLSNCGNLGEKWMDNVGSVQSLWRLNISRSEKMIRRWIEMQREKEDWNFVVLTDCSWDVGPAIHLHLILYLIFDCISFVANERFESFYYSSCFAGNRGWTESFMLKVAAIKVFDEGLLIDINGHPLYSFTSASSLIFIIEADEHRRCQIDGNLFEKNMQRLDLSSRGLSIIYAGRYFSELPSEVTNRIVAYTPSSSKFSSFFGKVYATFPEIYGRHTSVYRSRAGSEVEGIKCLSTWEDVSYVLNEAAALLRIPNESNVEILRAILQTDFLHRKNQ
ncbi:uncharacterized protein LOC131033964 isoform X2 [Cryptomeria japonica]|uniref:uncharacterized protein LOC131033964 isoform X1 n=1 Tax=Cryptomeria japonica TaxID=3369 RepID=UPI0027DA08AC|nr:uncharacterized protein LOC131033964 isoform X1 [Cryptomeria japonica]XP_059064063.1 uncharacterized protein LOC131033964 isoform X2 [Cryptomeria japonica]